MSISRDTIYTIQMLSGTSSDEKPTDVKSGSTFKEIDTGKNYIFDGTAWVLQPGAGGGGGGVMVINIAFGEGDSITADKSIQEICEAYFNGTTIMAKTEDEYGKFVLTAVGAATGEYDRWTVVFGTERGITGGGLLIGNQEPDGDGWLYGKN